MSTRSGENAPTVHICCAAYNGAPFITDFVHSLQAQTWVRWQLWVRDDGSTDATTALVTALGTDDGRIHLLPPDGQRLGVVGAFARLVESLVPEAEYIMFADQDDVWRPDKLTRSMTAMRAAEAEWRGPILVHTDLTVVDERLQEIHPSFWQYAGLRPAPVSFRRFVVHNVVTGATSLFNRALRDRVGAIPPTAAMHDWWVACVASAFGRVVALDVPTVLYRQHGANAIGARRPSSALRFRELPGALRGAMTRKALVQGHIRAGARQAGALYQSYGSDLASENANFLQAYARIPERGLLRRKLDVIRLHLRREHGLLRNVGILLRA